MVAAPAPDHAMPAAAPGLLAHNVVSKYDDHLPLYRQAEIFARDKVRLATSTLSDWVGATAAALPPLFEALAADLLTGDTDRAAAGAAVPVLRATGVARRAQRHEVERTFSMHPYHPKPTGFEPCASWRSKYRLVNASATISLIS
jgi:hypothetical protein